jgi:hypothetical protein
MAWVETASMSFTARHEASEGEQALAVLDALERYRVRLEGLFPSVPSNVTLVLHDSTLQLEVAQPYVAFARRLAHPAGRRYVTGWFTSREVHTLAPSALRRRAGGPASLEALLLAPQHAYALLVVAHNNESLPPPLRPAALVQVLRSGWSLEGAAQYLSGRLPHLRTAIGRRLRRGTPPIPPGPRDSALLGGALFDLLASERGVEAALRVACTSHRDRRVQVEEAFGSSLADLRPRWRTHVERLAARAATDG